MVQQHSIAPGLRHDMTLSDPPTQPERVPVTSLSSWISGRIQGPSAYLGGEKLFPPQIIRSNLNYIQVGSGDIQPLVL